MFMLRGLGEDWSTMTPDEPVTGEDRVAAATYCGKKYGTTSPSFQPCVDFYAGPHIGEYVASSVTPGVVIKTQSNVLKNFGITMTPPGSVVSTKVGQTAAGAIISTIAPSGVPWYKTPLGIGAIVLGCFVGYRKLKQRKAA